MTRRAPRRLAPLLAAALLAPVLASASPEQAAEGPAPVVERLHATLLEVMKGADELGYAGRRERLAPVLSEVFDLGFMAQKSVGRHWRSASPEEQQRLVQTFRRYIIANYAGRFDGYSGQAFETLGEQAAARDTMLVRTRLTDPEGDDVKLDYRLRRVDGHWKIIDIYLNGTVSELALRRSEYSSLIKREGFQALLATLDERIESLASAPADQG